MTAGAFKDDRERCLHAGMDDYLTKPIRPATLYARIEALTAPGSVAAPAGSESGPADAILDWSIALDQSGGNDELLRELITIFMEESGQLMTALRQAIAQQNAGEVRRLAHTIKGSANHFAARATVAAALRLERMGRDEELAGAEEACVRLEQELAQLQQALAGSLPRAAAQ
jgi:HPt (histidine-containing phosphotransfer) domain-containing protein